MKQLLLFLAALLFIGSQAFAQSSAFKELEREINTKIDQAQWEEVLIAATDLLIEEPGRGEGYYYTALAFYKQGHFDKAQEYLAQATPLADAALNTRIADLGNEIKTGREQTDFLASAEASMASGSRASAAGDFQKAWEINKSNISAALSAVELYLAQEQYEEALAILTDASLSQDPGARALVDRINSTPHMVAVNGYNSAMEQAQQQMASGNYASAANLLSKALSFKDEPAARDLKKQAEDELAWKRATNSHSIVGYEEYLGGNTNKKYADRAVELIRDALFVHGQEAAENNNIADMEQYLLKYLRRYSGGPYDSDVKMVLCDTYTSNAEALVKDRNVYSQKRAIEFYQQAKRYCTDSKKIEDGLARAKKRERRFGRPDRGYLSYVYDSIAPIGISFGSINNRSLGMYLSGSVNTDLFLETSYETLSDDDNVSGANEKTGYGDVVLGLTKKIAYPLWIYAGGGAAFVNKYYEFSDGDESEWLLHEDESAINPMVDAGLIVNLKAFFLRGGVKTDTEEYRFSAGVGFSW